MNVNVVRYKTLICLFCVQFGLLCLKVYSDRKLSTFFAFDRWIVFVAKCSLHSI